MRYYLMKKDPQFSRAPDVINWYGKIKVQDIKPGNYHLLPERLLLQIRANQNMDFIKILITPFFLVSEEIRECLELYEPLLGFKEIVLLDKKYKQAQEYFLPTLDEVDCLTEKCEYHRSRSHLLYTQIDLNKVGDKSIFYLTGISHNYVVVRLDVAESMIRRGARGFLLEEIDCR